MPEVTEPTITLLFDVKLIRPACVLLQAAAGGDRHVVSRYFYAETWLVGRTQDMRLVTGTLDQWKQLAERANRLTERDSVKW